MTDTKDTHGGKVNADMANAFFNDPRVVEHYRRATANVGLWVSEERLFRKVFQPDDRILELGSGTGRISFGLAELGYRHLLGIEICKEMVKEARRIARVLELAVPFRVGDATRLAFEDNLFDGAIFGFNGLMQIPGRDNRRRALQEIRRVVRPGGALVFTAHDRDHSPWRDHWRHEQELWAAGRQRPELIDFGDRFDDSELGRMFIHIPTVAEVRAELDATGWTVEWEGMRSSIARESAETLAFSDDTRFWVVRKL